MTRRGSWSRPSSAATRKSPPSRSGARAGGPLPSTRSCPPCRRTFEPNMIEAVKYWYEPNNKSHWDPEIDQGRVKYAELVKLARAAVKAESPQLTKVLGGISPIDPGFIHNLAGQGVLETVDAVAVHGFPLDWNHWKIHIWPERIAEIEAVTHLPVWVTEVGVSTFGAEEV